MAARFNGSISDVLNARHFISGQDMQETLLRYTALSNDQLLRSALKSKMPAQAMKDFYKILPHLFIRNLSFAEDAIVTVFIKKSLIPKKLCLRVVCAFKSTPGIFAELWLKQ